MFGDDTLQPELAGILLQRVRIGIDFLRYPDYTLPMGRDIVEEVPADTVFRTCQLVTVEV